jgi:hypothetical protein
MSSRLSSGLIGGIGIVLVIAGLVLDTIACHQVLQSYDDALLAKAQALVTLTEQDEDGIELELADELMAAFEDPSASSLVRPEKTSNILNRRDSLAASLMR